jgi:N-acyl-D-aspartate/D-glutamate deacylase
LSLPHPRAYGTFARILGYYVREEKILSLEDAVRKMASLPAQTLGLVDRGRVAPGFYADLVVFDPERIRDRATYTEPHQLAEGVVHVLVNGVPVIQNGRHTGAKPGRFVKGPGVRGKLAV